MEWPFVLHNISFSRSHNIIWEILGNLLIILNISQRGYNHDINNLYKHNFFQFLFSQNFLISTR